MTKMKMTLMMFACALALAAGCSKQEPTCDAVFDHTKSLAPAEMREMFEKNKEGALQKCAKMSKEAKQCALDAKSIEQLQKCPRA